MSLRNPLTGRLIKEDGRTHRKLIQLLGEIEEVLLEQSGGKPESTKAESTKAGKGAKILGRVSKTASSAKIGKTVQSATKKDQDFYSKLLKKSQKLDVPIPVSRRADEHVVIPKSKYHMISSTLPPNPEQHSWYHHHAPFSQNFGDYVCIKRSTLQDMGTFLRDSMLSDIH